MLHALDPVALADNTPWVGAAQWRRPRSNQPLAPCTAKSAPSLPVCPRHKTGLWGVHSEPPMGRTHTACPMGRRDCLPARGLPSGLLPGRAVGEQGTVTATPPPSSRGPPAAPRRRNLPALTKHGHNPHPHPHGPNFSQLQQPVTASAGHGSPRETPSNGHGDSCQNTPPAPRASGVSRGKTAARRSRTDAQSTPAPGHPSPDRGTEPRSTSPSGHRHLPMEHSRRPATGFCERRNTVLRNQCDPPREESKRKSHDHQ